MLYTVQCAPTLRVHSHTVHNGFWYVCGCTTILLHGAVLPAEWDHNENRSSKLITTIVNPMQSYNQA
jgi:hypothetical protein